MFLLMKHGRMTADILTSSSTFHGRNGEKEAIKIDEHHRGMDYIMLKMLAEDMKGTGVYPVNLNDLASWTSVTPLSKSSIKEKRIIKLG